MSYYFVYPGALMQLSMKSTSKTSDAHHITSLQISDDLHVTLRQIGDVHWVASRRDAFLLKLNILFNKAMSITQSIYIGNTILLLYWRILAENQIISSIL